MPYCTQLAIACVGLGERSCKVLSIGVASLGPQQVVCGCSLQASGSDAVGKGLPGNRQALLAHGKKNAATSDLVACAFRVSLTSLKSLKRSGVKVFCYLLRDPALQFTQGFFCFVLCNALDHRWSEFRLVMWSRGGANDQQMTFPALFLAVGCCVCLVARSPSQSQLNARGFIMDPAFGSPIKRIRAPSSHQDNLPRSLIWHCFPFSHACLGMSEGPHC